MLEYIQRYITEHRRAPFIREIQTACQIVSYKSAVDRLNALERKGFIRRTPNKHRAIQLRHRAMERARQPEPAAFDVSQHGTAEVTSAGSATVIES